MIKGAIFDVDGTLLDSMHIWDEAGERYLRTKGITAEPDLGERIFAMTMEEAAQYLKQVYRLEECVKEITEGINRQIEEFYLNNAEIKPGVIEFLDELKKRNITLTAATATDRYLIEGAFARLGLDEYFSRIFTCTEAGAGKEKPTIYRKAAAYMATAPKETLVFEDALHAIHTSVKAGYKTVAVYDSSSGKNQEKIRQAADIYLRRYEGFELFWQLLIRKEEESK